MRYSRNRETANVIERRRLTGDEDGHVVRNHITCMPFWGFWFYNKCNTFLICSKERVTECSDWHSERRLISQNTLSILSTNRCNITFLMKVRHTHRSLHFLLFKYVWIMVQKEAMNYKILEQSLCKWINRALVKMQPMFNNTIILSLICQLNIYAVKYKSAPLEHYSIQDNFECMILYLVLWRTLK